MQAAHDVAVRPGLAVHIETPGVVELTLQSCTECSMHGQFASVLIFHTHWPDAAWHLAPLDSAQSGRLAA